MTKSYAKSIGILALMLAVAVAPTSIAFAQTESDVRTANQTRQDAQEKMEERRLAAQNQMEERRETLQVRVQDVRSSAVTPSIERSMERDPDLLFRGATNGWAIVGNTAIPSSVTLHGEAYQIGSSASLLITSEGVLQIGDRSVDLDLKGYARGNVLLLQGTGTLHDGEPIRILLRGHFAPTDNENEFAVGFTGIGVQHLENGLRIPLMQVGSINAVPAQ